MSSRDWDDVADAVQAYIEKRARDSDLRDQYLVALSSNRWRNKAFGALVDAILASEKEIERTYARRDDDWLDYMEAGVPDIVDGHFAMSCLDDRTVSKGLSDRVYNEMRDAVDRYEKLVNPRGGRGRSGRDDRDDRRGGRDSDRGRGAEEYRREWDDRRRDRDSRGDRDDRRDAPAKGGGQWDVLARAAQDAQDDREDKRDSRDTRDDRRDERGNADRKREEPRRAEPEPEKKPEPKQPRPIIEGPDYTKARPFDEFWQRGDGSDELEHWQAAVLSDWELTGDGRSLSTRTPAFYDVNRWVKYLVKDHNGKVREELVPVDDENRYLSHQLMDNPQQRQAPAAQAAVSLKSLEEATGESLDAEQPVDNTVLLGDLAEEFQVPTIKCFNMETSLTGCIYRARSVLTQSDSRTALDWQLVRTPIVASGWNQLDLIQEIHETGNLSAAAEKMKQLKPLFDEPIWNELNKRFSQLVIRAVTYQFQLPGITNFSFADHWPNLLKWYDGKRDAAETAHFAKRASYIVGVACQHIGKAEVKDVLEDLTGGEPPPTVVFADFYLVASVKASLDQIGIGKQLKQSKTGVIITQQSNQRIRSSLVSLFQAADAKLDSNTRIRVCIATSDNSLVEIVPYAGRQENFILAQLS